MSEKLKNYIDPIKKFWGNLTKKKKIILLSVLAGIVAFSIIISALLNVEPYVVLYPGLDHSEAVEVMNELKDMGVSYKEENGTITVPQDKENSLRMQLSNEGHPKTAPNYDFFTKNVSVMSTDYEKKTIEKYQLNTRLEAVIKTLEGVQNCYVTISIPDENSYAWDSDSSAVSGSVTIQLESGKTLSAKQINGVKQLVAKSVPNLKVENVALIDSATGEELTAEDNSGNQVTISQFKLSIEKSFETDVEKGVMKVLTPLYGVNNVQVTAKSVMDVDKKIQDVITYNPSKDNKGVVNEENTDKEAETSSKASSQGVTGTQSNSDVSTYPGVKVDGNTIYTKDQQSYKYLVSQVKQQIQSDAASVKDLTISVVVNKTGMPDTEKQQVVNAVAKAAAVDNDKVSVYFGAFANSSVKTNTQPEAMPSLNQLLIYGGAALGTLLVVVIIAAVVLASKRKKKREEMMGPEEDAEVPEDFYELKGVSNAENAEELAEGEAEENIETADAKPKKPAKEKAVEAEPLRAIEETRAAENSKQEALTKEIRDFSSQNPEIAAQLIRAWLRGEEYNG
jgi:flagellar basal-body M-ring protein/flagellar hook-basal body protein (fliF)